MFVDSDSGCFFIMEYQHFFRPFSKKLMVEAQDMQLWFQISVYI